jgi:acylphosphatase
MTVRRRVTVRGRVQGVFFRDSVRRLAAGRGVAGSAVNLPDGAVEVGLEGPPGAVDELIAFCADGPDRAEVSAVEVTEEEPRGETGFRTG